MTYPFSETIARLGVDGSLKIVSSFDLSIAYPRGIAAPPGDDYLYICGQYRGVVRVRPDDFKVVDRWDIPMQDATHIMPITMASAV